MKSMQAGTMLMVQHVAGAHGMVSGRTNILWHGRLLEGVLHDDSAPGKHHVQPRMGMVWQEPSWPCNI